MVAYAPRHGEQKIPYGSVRRRMALHQPTSSRAHRTRTPQASHGLRAILDAVFYVLKSGCPWRLLPKDFPPWKTVYEWFRRWRIDGTWERLNTELRELSCGCALAGTLTPERSHSGLTVCEDHGGGRHTARLRPSKEGGR
jgi:transposase